MTTLLTLSLLLYPLPGLLAAMRRVPGWGSVLLLNLLLGWTVIFWFVALKSALWQRPSYDFPAD